jgi:hypothetical protein
LEPPRATVTIQQIDRPNPCVASRRGDAKNAAMTAKIFAGCAGRCGALFRPERNDSAKQEPRAATSSARWPPTGCAPWRRPVAAASSCRGPCSSLRAGRFGVLKQGRAPPRAMAIVENHDRCGVDVPLKRRGAEGSSASRRSNAACKSPKNAGFCALTLFVSISHFLSAKDGRCTRTSIAVKQRQSWVTVDALRKSGCPRSGLFDPQNQTRRRG